ncbi:MAG: hypothetical protein CMH64_01650 [Nanoarchaeota archaeon]|nr:hypothetical protein [Nanoarchaeota archaeon]|tara:strand:+ start:5844 stop:6089 length:246 start_codon:yes stop_codon:yes gene_type:complete
MIINIKYGCDLITLDTILKQIRYLNDPENLGKIEFLDLSFTDIESYLYLYNKDLKVFFETLKADLKSFLNMDIDIKKLVVI